MFWHCKGKLFSSILQTFWRFSLRVLFFFVILQQTRIARKGGGSKTYWEKDVYGRYLRLSNLANSSPEETQQRRPLWVYCTQLFLYGLRQYVSAWAIELLILDKAMREPDSGISLVEHPRLSV